MERFTYNNTHKFTKIIEPPSQEEIYNCPHYFAMSYEQVKSSGAPQFLIKLLDQFPFDGRKNLLQIRPQDFRTQNAGIDGAFWHVDDNVRLINSQGAQQDYYAKDEFDWHIMTISWGHGAQTEFITKPVELTGSCHDMVSWQADFTDFIGTVQGEIISAPKNQMVEYTSRDVHRADGIWHSKGLRLFVVAFDCSDLENQVRILPSIRQLEGK